MDIPTEIGVYWVVIRGDWDIAEIIKDGFGKHRVWLIGVENDVTDDDDWIDEWGPRIEPPEGSA